MSIVDTHLVEFALASLALIALPGPDQALITRNTLVGGQRAGRRTMLGGVSGLTVHAGAAAFGISALLATSATAYATLKIVGIAYLLYLGVRMIAGSGDAAPEESEERSAGRPFAQGLLSNALNPKVALFFLTFLPQFLPADGPSLPAALVFSAVFALVYLAWFSVLIRAVEYVADALRKPRVKAWMERVTGGALIGFGARLALHR